MQQKQKGAQPEHKNNSDTEGKDSWADDQQKHSYYYDDSHGYEEFKPDEETEDEDQAAS
jgi:hypothetical protein